MPADVKRALVLGGTGTVGRHVLRSFAEQQIPTTFTYFRSADRARMLSEELGQRAVPLDLADLPAFQSFLRGLDEVPRIVVHAAAILSDDFAASHAVNVQSAYVAARELAPRLEKAGGGDIVFLGALDRTQSLPIPAAFAATQGALAAMTMALAKELGPKGIRVNMVASGLLGEGLSTRLDPKLIEDFKAFSAFRRTGAASEVARAVRWLACENSYMTGRVVPVNGGI
jgi:3-oxoacyl-[acyl-carrier protein] reductase